MSIDHRTRTATLHSPAPARRRPLRASGSSPSARSARSCAARRSSSRPRSCSSARSRCVVIGAASRRATPSRHSGRGHRRRGAVRADGSTASTSRTSPTALRPRRLVDRGRRWMRRSSATRPSPLGFAVIAESIAPTQLLLTLAQVPPVELLDPDDSNRGPALPRRDRLRRRVPARRIAVRRHDRAERRGGEADARGRDAHLRDPGPRAAGRQGRGQHGAGDGADLDPRRDRRSSASPSPVRARSCRGSAARSRGSRCSSCSASCCSRRCSRRPRRWCRARRTSARRPCR